MKPLAFGLILLTTGCMVGPNYKAPAMPAPPAFKEAPPDGWKAAQPSDGMLHQNWWEIFGDARLNELASQVKVSNQNVLALEAQFREAQQTIIVARSALFPVIGGAASASGGRSSTGQAGGSGLSASYGILATASYTADVWGGIRRTVSADQATAQATAAQLENARLLYTSELVSDYFQLRGLDRDAQLLDDTMKSYQQFLQLTKDRYAGGIASMGDVAQAETQLETTHAQLIDLGVQRAQLEHAIAVLTGKSPAELSIVANKDKAVLPAIPLVVPSALLERRPDIAASERQVKAANEQIGVATAALYPTISLTGSAGPQGSDLLRLFNGPSYLWSLGGQLTQTFFDRGKRRAQIAITKEAYNATVDNYRQTVLTAFQQVEDELAALRILEQEAIVQDRAVAASRQSLDISTAQYEGGINSYLQVITAQSTALQNQRSAVDIETRRVVASVSLIQALGGGWDVSQLPKV